MPATWIQYLILIALSGLVLSGSAVGTEKETPATKIEKKDEKDKEKAKKLAGLNEQEALHFAEQHHKELHQLVKLLRKHDDNEYRRAIRELSNAVTRINRYQQRDPERYEAELALWKVNSQIKLLLAHLAMEGDEATQNELRDLLTRRRELMVQLVDIEQERLARSLERLEQREQQLSKTKERLQTNSSEAIEKEFISLINKAQGLKPVKPDR